jgi:putative peptidoglycan lipid II flippase
VIGRLLQFAALATVLVGRLGLRYRLAIDLGSLGSSQAGRLFVVSLVDYALAVAILIAERMIGSFMPTGSISAISNGHRVAAVITNVLFAGVEVVSLSSLAADFAKGTLAHLRRVRETFIAGLRMVLVIGVPVGISVCALSLPLVELLYQRGAFDRRATLLAAPVLALYALSIPLYGCWYLVRNYLLATVQPKRVLALAGTSAGAYVALALLLPSRMGAGGVALAYVGAAGAVCGLSFAVLGREWRSFQSTILGLAARVGSASVATGLILYSANKQVLQLLSRVHNLSIFFVVSSSLALTGGLGAILLPGLLIALRVEEATFLARYVRERRTG